MTWTYEHTITTTAPPAAIWRRYSDVATWPEWDGDNEWTTLDGPFAAGTEGRMKIRGMDPLGYTLVEVDDGRFFSDEVRLDDLVVGFEHRLEADGTGTRMTHRVVVSGPGEDEVGPQITVDVPDAMAALAALALKGK